MNDLMLTAYTLFGWEITRLTRFIFLAMAVFFVLYIIKFVFYIIKFINLWKLFNSIKRTDDLSEVAEQIKTCWDFTCKDIKHQFSEYREQCWGEKPDIYNREQFDKYVNIETLFPNISNGNIAAILTSLGILGTFMGVALGLHGFSMDIHHPENLAPEITNLLSGMKTAFITSIVGLILAIIVTFLNGVIIIIANMMVNKIVDTVDSIVDRGRPEELLVKIEGHLNQGQNAISNAIKESGIISELKDMTHQLTEALEKTQERRFEERLAEFNVQLERMTDTTENVTNSYNKTIKAQEILQNSFKQAAQKVEISAHNIEKSSLEMSAMANGLTNVVNNVRDSMIESVNSFGTGVKKTSLASQHLAEQVEKVNETYKLLTKESSAASKNFVGSANKIKETTESLQNISEKNKDALEGMASIVDSIKDSLHSLPELVEMSGNALAHHEKDLINKWQTVIPEKMNEIYGHFLRKIAEAQGVWVDTPLKLAEQLEKVSLESSKSFEKMTAQFANEYNDSLAKMQKRSNVQLKDRIDRVFKELDDQLSTSLGLFKQITDKLRDEIIRLGNR